MDISERKQKILKAIIDNYITTAEPVGSKALAEHTGLGLSSATIRNEMAELEAMGYLEQPHTSAGRIPSPRGYRIYVDELMRKHRMSLAETEEINKILRRRVQELDRMLTSGMQMLSKLMNYPAYVLQATEGSSFVKRFDLILVEKTSMIVVLLTENKVVKNKLLFSPTPMEEHDVKNLAVMLNQHFTNIDLRNISPESILAAEKAAGSAGRMVMLILDFAIETANELRSHKISFAGASHILEQPEYRDTEKAKMLLDYLLDDENLALMPAPDKSSPIKIMIGPENVAKELKDASVVVVSCDMPDNMKGFIGMVGPTRMNYAKVAANLSYFAKSIGRMNRDENAIINRNEQEEDN